ncbi:MAG: YihY/virulence factor BrkB family protein [Pedobacter sp.]|nr:MAG: YihY/virulence factor BrkB family protein [Pedobacter sp.]
MAIQELQLKENVRYKVVSIPSSLLRPTPKIVVGDENTYFNTLNTSLDKITASVVKTFLPKKMGFLEKWLLGFVAKKSVKKIMENKVENPKIENEQFTPVPIAMKTTVIKEPKEISSTKTVEVKKKEKFSLKGIWEVLKASFTGFGDHKVTKISGSLAYYTVFSMAPLMVVVIALCSLFLEREAAEGQIYAQLKGFLGAETAVQMQEIIKNAAIADKGLLASIIGGVTLLIGATTVFGDIQDSINTIWGIKPKPKRGWLKMLQNRFLSFSVIVSLGFLLLVSLAVSAVLDGFSNRLRARFEDVSVILFYILNTAITFAVVTTIFAVVFKVLPDAKIRWKDVMAGAMVTAVLFMAGKFGISFYIGQSDVGGTYGAAGSLVILLLWAYYSSIILYFGAEFTKAYAVKYGAEIHPNAYAVTMKEVEVEQGGASIQEIEESKQN